MKEKKKLVKIIFILSLKQTLFSGKKIRFRSNLLIPLTDKYQIQFREAHLFVFIIARVNFQTFITNKLNKTILSVIHDFEAKLILKGYTEF